MSHSKVTFFNGIANTLGASVNCLYLNARSIRNKFLELENFVSSRGRTYHVIIITETWLNKGDTTYYNLQNYHSFHSTREDPNIKRGGGVSIYVLKSFDTANEIGNKYWQGNNCLVVELLREKKKIIAIYRQPNNQFDSQGLTFIDELGSLLGSIKDAYVFGDFNFNIFESSNVIEKYKDAIALNDFIIVNSRQTTQREKITRTELSLVLITS